MATIQTSCLKCCYIFSEQDVNLPCPKCGNIDKFHSLHAVDHINLLDGIHGVQKRKGYPRNVVEYKERTKISKKGRLAKEKLYIDRTNKDTTIKIHHVEELLGSEWKVVHDEIEQFPAKRRPK